MITHRASIIAAVADNGVIGVDGDLPWHLPADLAHFEKLTMGHHLIVGRRTLEEVGWSLPGRTLVVVTRDPQVDGPGIRVARSLDEALELTVSDDQPFIGGGTRIFREALERRLADIMYLTRVHATPEGDTWFPEFDHSQWRLEDELHRPADADNAFAMTFETWRWRSLD